MNEEKLLPQRRFEGFTEEWQLRKWVDTVDISTNMVDPKTGNYDELLHLGPGNIESFTGRVLDNIKKVKDENLISGKFYFNRGDVIYGKINPQLGKYVLSSFDGLASADAYVLNTKNGVMQDFLYRILQTSSFYKYSVSVSSRTGMPKINRDELNQYNFCTPLLEEQQKIGQFFKHLDEMIALEQRKIDKTKALKSAYLAEMFPAAGERVPKRRFEGFTSEWKKFRLDDVAIYRRGSFPQPYGNEHWYDKEDGLPFVQVVDVGKDLKLVDNTKQKISKLAQPHSVFVEKGKVLVTLQGSIGRVAITQYPSFVDRTILIFESYKLDVNKEYFAYIIQLLFDKEKLKAPGGTIKTITKEALSEFLILLPNLEEQEKIGGFFKNLDYIITIHQRKLDKLKATKQAYLHEMFV